MAEDSGAFKTNQRNSAQIGHFVIARELRQGCLTDRENLVHRPTAVFRRIFCNKQLRSVEIFSNRSDSQRAKLALWSPRSLQASTASSRPPPKAEPATMLPGFRFVFAAVILSMSILVFGL